MIVYRYEFLTHTDRSITMIRKAIDKITIIITWIVGILMSLTILLIAANIIMRTMFTSPIKGAVELVQYSIMTIAVMIMSRTCFEDKHIYVTALVEKFPKKLQAWIYAIGRFICAVLFGIMAYQLFKSLGGVSERVSDILHLPITIMYTIMSIGITLSTITFAAQGCFFIADAYKKPEGGAAE